MNVIDQDVEFKEHTDIIYRNMCSNNELYASYFQLFHGIAQGDFCFRCWRACWRLNGSMASFLAKNRAI